MYSAMEVKGEPFDSGGEGVHLKQQVDISSKFLTACNC